MVQCLHFSILEIPLIKWWFPIAVASSPSVAWASPPICPKDHAAAAFTWSCHGNSWLLMGGCHATSTPMNLEEIYGNHVPSEWQNHIPIQLMQLLSMSWTGSKLSTDDPWKSPAAPSGTWRVPWNPPRFWEPFSLFRRLLSSRDLFPNLFTLWQFSMATENGPWF